MCQCEKKCQNCCSHKDLKFEEETVECIDCGKKWINYTMVTIPPTINLEVNSYEKTCWNGYRRISFCPRCTSGTYMEVVGSHEVCRQCGYIKSN